MRSPPPWHPDVLLLDEVLAVGMQFRMKCGRRLGRSSTARLSFCLALGALYQRLCNEVLLLHHGKVAGQGRPAEILAAYAATTHSKPGPLRQSLAITFGAPSSSRRRPGHRMAAHLTIQMSITVSNSTRCDQAYLNITDNADAIHAQVILDGVVGELEAERLSSSLPWARCFCRRAIF